MRPLLLALALIPAAPGRAPAQWQLQTSHTTASLRGIHAVSGQVAWASGTSGTVLHTTDGGVTWLPCTTPPSAEHLDFRGVQAFDATTAIVMSSGKGDLSRLYKTTDSCLTWHLVFTNPDPEGFWDTIQFSLNKDSYYERCFGQLIGDPIDGRFAMFISTNCGDTWERQIRDAPKANPGEALFAASNSSLIVSAPFLRTFVTGGAGFREITLLLGIFDDGEPDSMKVLPGAIPFRFIGGEWSVNSGPISVASQSSGAFSIAFDGVPFSAREVIVGGNYKKPDESQNTAWFEGQFRQWTAAATPPHGFRSAVAYAPTHRAWITVGPNGTDLSTDDGRNWRPLHPTTPDASPEEDRNWNALSLPFAVGPNGRIGRLRPTALP